MIARLAGHAVQDWVLDEAGVLPAARQVPSPNCDARPEGAGLDLGVIHNISLPPGVFAGDAVERLFCNRLDRSAHPYFEGLHGLRVSAHFFVRRSGEIIQFVPCGLRAWHAGASIWQGRERCNDFSVGIELEGVDELAYAPGQYAAIAGIGIALRRRYGLARFVGHADIAPGRKTDPGAAFDWIRFRSALGRG